MWWPSRTYRLGHHPGSGLGWAWLPVSPVDSLRGWRSHPARPERVSWPLGLLTVLLLLCPQMLSCLEHMYHDLGLVRDFGINPITLKRWLVSVRPPRPPDTVSREWTVGAFLMALGFLQTEATLP